jgi:hypothetical protein
MPISTISVGEGDPSPPEVLDAAKAAVDTLFAMPDPTMDRMLRALVLVVVNTVGNLAVNWPKLEAEFGFSRDQALIELAEEAQRVLREVDDYDCAGHA